MIFNKSVVLSRTTKYTLTTEKRYMAHRSGSMFIVFRGILMVSSGMLIVSRGMLIASVQKYAHSVQR